MKTRSLAGVASAVVLAAGICAGAPSARALPITWTLQNAVFDDGGTASGSFTIGPYGYLNAPVTGTTTAGNLLGGHAYLFTDPTNIIPGSPPAYGVEFHSATYNLTLHLEFQNSLETGGVDQLILASSWECASFSCPGPDYGSPGANTRYFISGSAVAAAEPTALGLLLLGIAGAVALRRRSAAALHA
jgi:hypothetical protein